MKENLRTAEKYKFPVSELRVAGNYGPCGGVNMALSATHQVLDIVRGREPVYTNWDIVNNVLIMQELKKKGLVNVGNNFDNVPDNSILLFSAHGVPPRFYEIAREKNLLVIDVTCQLVGRVHTLARNAEAAGKHIVYIGVAGHPETMGVMGEVDPQNITLVQKAADVLAVKLPDKPKVVYSQTTLLPREVGELEKSLSEKFPEIEIPSRLDVCYAMYNRQAAVEALLKNGRIDLLLVVGSRHSHNSQELRLMGDQAGIPSYSVDGPAEIDIKWFPQDIRKVGLTAGASVLDRYTRRVINWFRRRNTGLLVTFEDQVIPEKQMTFAFKRNGLDALKERYKVA